MNDFAKSQLMKYGWTEGKGLGKHEDGITKALKPKLKFDTTGIGHKENDCHNWWEIAFNKAANNIQVDSQVYNISISTSNENTSNNLTPDLNKMQFKYPLNYENFLKTSTLLNGNLITKDSSNILNIEDVNHVPLTDEELFKICGGRTAHKGARHGLTLNGKLNRIAQQEKALLDTDAYRNISKELKNNNNKPQNSEYEISDNEISLLPIHPFTEELIVPEISKHAKKKIKKKINNLTDQLNILCNVSDNKEKNLYSTDNGISEKELQLKKTEKKRKRKKEAENLISGNVPNIETGEVDNATDILFPVLNNKMQKKMKKKIKQQLNAYCRQNLNDKDRHTKKKKKLRKKKNQDSQYMSEWESEELDGSKAKKLRKSQISESVLQLNNKNEVTNTLECEFQKLSHNGTPTKSNQANDPVTCTDEYNSDLSDIYLRKRVDKLNSKIAKKKKNKLLRKQKAKLYDVTEHLKSVHFNTEESRKESTKNKVRTAIENIMATNMALDKTESLKDKKKSKRNKKC